jgi:hypothetical protein
VQISKGPGRGLRTLRIRNAADRVIDRAIAQVLRPCLDPSFAAASFGFRPRLGREHALAYAEAIGERDGLWVWVFYDLKDAFDNVPVGRLMDVVRQRLGAEDMVELVRVVIGNGSTTGIPQGSSLSPVSLNLYSFIRAQAFATPGLDAHGACRRTRLVDDAVGAACCRSGAGPSWSPPPAGDLASDVEGLLGQVDAAVPPGCVSTV